MRPSSHTLLVAVLVAVLMCMAVVLFMIVIMVSMLTAAMMCMLAVAIFCMPVFCVPVFVSMAILCARLSRSCFRHVWLHRKEGLDGCAVRDGTAERRHVPPLLGHKLLPRHAAAIAAAARERDGGNW